MTDSNLAHRASIMWSSTFGSSLRFSTSATSGSLDSVSPNCSVYEDDIWKSEENLNRPQIYWNFQGSKKYKYEVGGFKGRWKKKIMGMSLLLPYKSWPDKKFTICQNHGKSRQSPSHPDLTEMVSPVQSDWEPPWWPSCSSPHSRQPRRGESGLAPHHLQSVAVWSRGG